MQFDLSLYPRHAVLTESSKFDEIQQRLTLRNSLLMNTLGAFSDVAETLDVNKKQIFYGKNFVADGDVGNTIYTPEQIRALHAIIGIATEAGELVDGFLDMINGKMSWVDFCVNMMEEGGDVEWYQALLRDITGLSELVEKNANNNKLLVKRYGLVFSEDKANTRDLEAELKSLANPNTLRDDQFIIVNVGDALTDIYNGVEFNCIWQNDCYAILVSDDSTVPVILNPTAPFVPAYTKNEYVNPICAVNIGNGLELLPRFNHVPKSQLA